MSLSCEKVRTSDRTADEERFLEEARKHPEWQRGTLKPYDPVNHPPHYNNSAAKCECGRRIECIDVTRHLAFNVGNAIKYLWRCELKGNTVEDLEKAAWYIADEIKKRKSSK